MSEQLEFDPGKSDLDFVNALALHQEVFMKRKSMSNEKSQYHGVLEQPIVIDQKLQVSGENRKPTVKDVLEDRDTGEITLKTRQSTYELFVPNCDDVRLSLRYLRWGLLNYHERMPDGFMDGGRTTQYSYNPTLQLMSRTSKRETMLADARIDTKLREFTQSTQEKLSPEIIPYDRVQERIICLGQLVSDYYGGLSGSEVWRCEDAIRAYQDGDTSKVVPIGAITPGHCRYRSEMYKYQADRNKIPCRLVRGKLGGGHAWNIVRVGDEDFLEDTMHSPDVLLNVNQAWGYRRLGAMGDGGGAGMDSVVYRRSAK